MASVQDGGVTEGWGVGSTLEGGPAAPRQPDPTFDPVTGLVVAGWPATFSFPTRRSDGTPWLTGIYLIMLTKDDGRQTAALFIVRDDTRDAEVGVQLPTATYQAYNNYGGESLYESSHGLSGGKARKVSLDRPIARQYGNGTGTFLYQELEGVMWLEDHGYDVEYQASSDTGAQTVESERTGCLPSSDMKSTPRWLSSTGYKARSQTARVWPSLPGTRCIGKSAENNDRVIVGYKDNAAEDPMRLTNPSLVTSTFRNPPGESARKSAGRCHVRRQLHHSAIRLGRDQCQSLGVCRDWPEQRSRIPNLVLPEWDALVNNGLTPAGITVLASSVVPNNIPPYPVATNRRFMNEVTHSVFAAGSIFFSQHIRSQPAVGQMVANLLTRAGAGAHKP